MHVPKALHEMTFVRLLFIMLLLLVSHGSSLQILLEHTRADFDEGAAALQEETNGTSDSLDLLLLDGSMCNEFSTGGALVSSGIQQLSSFLAIENSGKIRSAKIAIISVKCIAECLIIQSVLEKFNKSTLVLSLNPKVLHHYPDVTSKEHNMTVFPVVDTHNGLKQNIRVESLLQKIETSGAKVLVVLTEEAPHILCAAYARGMVWPYYGWIIYGYTSPDVTNFPACTGSFSYRLPNLLLLPCYKG